MGYVNQHGLRLDGQHLAGEMARRPDSRRREPHLVGPGTGVRQQVCQASCTGDWAGTATGVRDAVMGARLAIERNVLQHAC
jgi:hypothetical protein